MLSSFNCIIENCVLRAEIFSMLMDSWKVQGIVGGQITISILDNVSRKTLIYVEITISV